MDPRPSKLSRLVNKHPETQIEDYIDYRPIIVIIVFNVIKKENKKNFIFLVSQKLPQMVPKFSIHGCYRMSKINAVGTNFDSGCKGTGIVLYSKGQNNRVQ